jgi:hypothetical protein
VDDIMSGCRSVYVATLQERHNMQHIADLQEVLGEHAKIYIA